MQDTQAHRRVRSPHARPFRPAARQPRRQANWGRRIKLIGLILLVTFVLGLAFLIQRAAAFNGAVSTESALSMRLFGPLSGGDRVNILLLGYPDETHGGAFLSDSMNLLSIDRETDTTTLIAIPRDLWVEGIPEVPQNMKINEAFAIGYYADGFENGAQLAAEAVSVVTGLAVDGWITLDFQGFEAIVDAVGGVTVENPAAFEYTWAEENYLAGIWEGSFDAGTLHLNGADALSYARNRYTSVITESSDFARSVRQQRVLQAIRGEMTGWLALPKGLAISTALEGHMHTDLSVWDLGMLAGKLDVDQRVELPEDVIIRATTNSIGQYVLVVIGQASSTDYSPLHAYIAEELSNPPLPSPIPSASP
jgi:polyisoprenyl-teichoic acid--peptidoglycan teichoic acid transferase